MDEHLIHGGDMLQASGAGAAVALPASAGVFMKKWFRTSKAIVMYLSNGTLQVTLTHSFLYIMWQSFLKLGGPAFFNGPILMPEFLKNMRLSACSASIRATYNTVSGKNIRLSEGSKT
jgi:uncharacterized membrane protein YgdD (TMEM256/DUF423 family)